MATDKELRQRVGWAIARAENVISEQEDSLTHLRSIHSELTERITVPEPVEPPVEPEPPVVEPPEPPVEPEPEPEPPVEPIPEPSGTWTHSWSQYTDTAAMLRDTVRLTPRVWANTGGSLELAREGGTAFLRTNWGGGPYVGANDEQIALDVNLPDHARSAEITLDLPLRYSKNFRVGSDHKTLFVFTEDGQRWEWRFGGHRVRGQAKLDNNNVAIWTKGGREVDITNPPVIWDGSWHLLRLHLKSGGSGRFRAWLDGELMVDAAMRTGASRFSVVALSRNGDPVERSTLDWGDVGVTVGPPA